MKSILLHIISIIIIISYIFIYFISAAPINSQIANNFDKIKSDSRVINFLGKPKITKNERKISFRTLQLLPLTIYKNTSGIKNSLFVVQFLNELKTKYLFQHQNISLLRAPPVC